MFRVIPPSRAVPGEPAKVFLVADDPGVVDLTYSGPISGPSQITIPGSRQYRYGGNPAGQYAARLLSSGQGQDRSPASWLIRLRPEDIAGAVAHEMAYNWSGTYFGCPLVWCGQPNPGAAMTARLNWMVTSYWAHGVAARSLRANYVLWASRSPTANPSQYPVSSIEYGNAEQYAAACVITVSGSTLNQYMLGPNGQMQTATASCSLSGTMGGTEVICAQWPFEQFLKYSRAITAQEAADWLLYGTIPSDPQIAYLGGHEIDGPQRVYDSGPMALDLGGVDLGVYPGTGFASPVCSHKFSGDAAIQGVPVNVTITRSGTCTVSARRRRVGVPERAPETEKYETAESVVFATDSHVAYFGPSLALQVGGDEAEARGRLFLAGVLPGEYEVSTEPESGLLVPSKVTVAEGEKSAVVPVIARAVGSWTVSAAGAEAEVVSTLAPEAVAGESGPESDLTRAIDGWLSGIDCYPPFVRADVAEVRTTNAAPRQYARYILAVSDSPVAFGVARIEAQIIIAYDGIEHAEADASVLRESFSNYAWPVVGIEAELQTGFEPGYVAPRVVVRVVADMLR